MSCAVPARRGPADPAVLAGRHERDRLRRPVARINRPIPADERPRTTARLRVGLLGGSFNPAHEGHVQASLTALRKLKLDRVYWLVSPQNPLKSRGDMAELDRRLAQARRVARHPRIVVTDVERRLGTRYTVDTLARLVRRRGPRFVWLIGADNLVQLPRWRNWRRLVETVPVAVLDREPYGYRALVGKVAQAYHKMRMPGELAGTLTESVPPVWVFLRWRRHPASSTALRRSNASS